VNIDLIGWDIGGAHLKAVALQGERIVSVRQRPCPLWQGLACFHEAVAALLRELSPSPGCRHALTMTGELADLFANREAGVFSLIDALCQHVPAEQARVFAGRSGFLAAHAARPEHVLAIASANWLATGFYATSLIPQALLIDIGSTTGDLLILRDGQVLAQGYTDSERLRHGELVYSGASRTSLMAVARQAPLEGEWVGLMAEHFATTADVYRLTAELPEHADQFPAADNSGKTAQASARRLARLLGRDVESADLDAWRRLAYYFREQQLAQYTQACLRQLSRGLLQAQAPFIGAGVGRFLVQELAARLKHPYLDFLELFHQPIPPSEFHIADCAPAAAVAFLARQGHA
jgi:probable H4MPT-linked C1 transfer pathway protein